jgi:hypothetical protein
MPGRTQSSTIGGYKYAHNGQEKDNEIFDGALTAEFWEYDSRLGRRFETDPIVNESESPYATFNNCPIALSDPDGLFPGPGHRKKGGNHGNFQSKRRNHVHKNKGHNGRFFHNIKNGLSNLKQKFLHRLGHLDFNIGNHRVVSRRYRNITGFWNPFYHSSTGSHHNTFFKNFPLPHFGISIGLRLWNFVIFDIKIGEAEARWEDFFPGDAVGASGNKIKFFYKIDSEDPAGKMEMGCFTHYFFPAKTGSFHVSFMVVLEGEWEGKILNILWVLIIHGYL